ncbi:MAG: RHS repeat-associated core domain-containing protein, partial [Armatimonadota bacterium]
SNRKSDDTIIAQFDYTYGPSNCSCYGNRTQVIENILKPDGNRINAQVDYEYDALGRLTREHRTAYGGGDAGVTYDYYYTYDQAGNRTSWQVVGGSTTNYTYDDANKMTSPGTFTYDDAGNTLTHTIDSVTTTYTWDYLNRMTRWAKTGETTQDYVYNADGMRVRKTPSGGTATNFLLDRIEIAEEITGNDVTSYVGPRLISEISGTTRIVYHPDGLGSTRNMTNGSQVVQEADIYDAYGNAQSGFSSTSNFAYAGQNRYYTDSTGLDYLKFRYYDPRVGRFVSRDPIGYKGGLNLFAYADNSPTRKIDPLGTAPADYECCRRACVTTWNAATVACNASYMSCLKWIGWIPGGEKVCEALFTRCATAAYWSYYACMLGCQTQFPY